MNITNSSKIDSLPSGDNTLGTVTIGSLSAGNNNIGDIDIASIAAGDNNIGNVDLASSIPAGSNTIGTVTIGSLSAGSNTIGTVTIGSLSAGSNTIGSVSISGAIPTGNNNIGDIDVASIAAGDNNIGNVDVLTIAAGDNNIGNVDVVTLPALASGSNIVGSATVSGDVVHDGVDAGNPIKIGARVETSIAGVTLAADGDRTNLYADSDGVQVIKPFTTYGDILTENVADTGGTSTNFTNFSAVAGSRNYITSIIVWNSSATNGYVDIRDSSTGSVMITVPAPTVGGSIINFPLPFPQKTAGSAIAYDVSGALSTVYITIVGFRSKI